jgi:hypothetical protein
MMSRKEYIHGHADNPVVDKLIWLVHGDVDLLTEAVVACSKEVLERPHWYSLRKKRRWKVDLQEVTAWIIKKVREEDERSSTS